MTEKWESEIWAAVSARQLPRSTTNGRYLARGSNLKGSCAAQARPSPGSQAPARSVPASPLGSSAFWGRRRPEGLAVTRPGPSPAPQPPRKKAHSLLFRHLLPNPAEPPRPPSAGLAGPALLPASAGGAGRPTGSGAESRLREAGISVPSSLWPEVGGCAWEDPGELSGCVATSFSLWPREVQLFPSTGLGRFGETPELTTEAHPESAPFLPVSRN